MYDKHSVNCGLREVSGRQSNGKIDKSIEKVEKNKDKMTKKDFEALDKEMEEPLKVLNDALENDEVGALDKLKIVGKVTKWAAVLVSAGFKVVGDELGKELKESGVTGEDVKKALEGSGNDDR